MVDFFIYLLYNNERKRERGAKMTVTEQAYAKINLFLDVTERRDDGFHNIVSIMHSVRLCDELIVTAEASDKTEIFLTSSTSELPTDENNLVYRAAKAYLSEFNLNAKVNVALEKRIPIGAGLGGGSSDAAATLRALNKIFGLATYNQLNGIAENLGSDVPFCLVGGLCLCMGRGERISQLYYPRNIVFVIAIGDSRVSTPKAYAALDEMFGDFQDGTHDSEKHSALIVDLLLGKPEEIPIYNVFEQVIHFDEINKIKEIMKKNGAEYALMSGSGPAVFCACPNGPIAENICDALQKQGFDAFVCESVYNWENL